MGHNNWNYHVIRKKAKRLICRYKFQQTTLLSIQFLIFPKKYVWHIMQIVDNLHEMSKPLFQEK